MPIIDNLPVLAMLASSSAQPLHTMSSALHRSASRNSVVRVTNTWPPEHLGCTHAADWGWPFNDPDMIPDLQLSSHVSPSDIVGLQVPASRSVPKSGKVHSAEHSVSRFSRQDCTMDPRSQAVQGVHEPVIWFLYVPEAQRWHCVFVKSV